MPLSLVLAGFGCHDGRQQASITAPSGQVDRALTGTVVESGTHAPVPDARVCIWQQTNGDLYGDNCALTGLDGSYTIVFTSPVVGNCPTVKGQDFEWRQDCVNLTYPKTSWSPSIQRIIRIGAGETIAATVFPDDTGGIVFESSCVSCKRIRIVAARAGKLTVRLLPENAGLQLTFLDDNQRPNQPVPVQAGHELTVLVTREGPSAPRSFELSTAFVAD